MVEITGSMVSNFLHLDSSPKKSYSFYRIDQLTGRIDSKATRVNALTLSRPGSEFYLDPTRYSKIPGSPATEKVRLDLLRINPTLSNAEILKKLFGAPPPPPPVIIAQPAPAPIIQASIIPSATTLGEPVAAPTIKQTVSQLLPQLDAPIQGQVNKIPILPIAAVVGAGILIFAVVRKKRK